MTDINYILEYLADASHNGNLFLIVGAGISRDHPSSLPIANDLTACTMDLLIDHCPIVSDQLRKYRDHYLSTPFEEFLGTIWRGVREYTIELLRPLRGGIPNSNHKYISKLIVSKAICGILTTNFDNLLEVALGQNISKVDVFYSYEIYAKDDSSHIDLFKVHGSFVDSNGRDISRSITTTTDTIAKSLNIASVCDWQQLLAGKTLLVLGYSGQDRLDLITIVDSLGTSSIVWINHRDTPNLSVIQEYCSALSPDLAFILQKPTGLRCCIEGCTSSFLKAFGSAISIPFVRNTGTTQHDAHISPKIDLDLFHKFSYQIAGTLLQEVREYGAACRSYTKFVESCNQADARFVALALLASAQCCIAKASSRRRDLYNRAESYLDWVQQYFFSQRDDYGQAAVLIERAIMESKQGRRDDSWQLLLMAGAYGEKIDPRSPSHIRWKAEIRAKTEYYKAILLLKSKRFNEAAKFLDNAINESVIANEVKHEISLLRARILCERRWFNVYFNDNILRWYLRINLLLWSLGKQASPIKSRLVKCAHVQLAKALFAGVTENPKQFIVNDPIIGLCGIGNDILFVLNCLNEDISTVSN